MQVWGQNLSMQYNQLFATNLGANPVSLGLLNSIGSGISSIASIPMGWAAEEYGVKKSHASRIGFRIHIRSYLYSSWNLVDACTSRHLSRPSQNKPSCRHDLYHSFENPAKGRGYEFDACNLGGIKHFCTNDSSVNSSQFWGNKRSRHSATVLRSTRFSHFRFPFHSPETTTTFASYRPKKGFAGLERNLVHSGFSRPV